jgi:hypothetical protein
MRFGDLTALVATLSAQVVCLNWCAPRRVAQRVFKLSWLLPTCALCAALFWLISTASVDMPSLLQRSQLAMQRRHQAVREQCAVHVQRMEFELAYSTIATSTQTEGEMVVAEAETNDATAAVSASGAVAHTLSDSVGALLRPLLNTLLFNTGVAFTFVPALLRLLLLLVRGKMRERQSRSLGGGARGQQAQWEDSARREWGVFLPVMNLVALISVCVAPTFYLWIEPGRAHRCIYSSGHWSD